jgi:autotransporter-associated beta strand protein
LSGFLAPESREWGGELTVFGWHGVGHPEFRLFRSRRALLSGVGQAALLASLAAGSLLGGAAVTRADDFVWAGPGPSTKNTAWENLSYWQQNGAAATRLPGASDSVTFPDGYVSVDALNNFVVSSTPTVEEVNLEGGTLSVSFGSALNVGTLNISDGGNLYLPKAKADSGQADGTVIVSGAVNLSGGTIDRNGHVAVGPDGVFNQTGGAVIRNVTVDTPTYLQSGGDVGTMAAVTSDDYQLSGDGTIDGTVDTTTFEQSGGQVTSNAEITADSYAQSGGDMSGSVTADSYDFTGGSVGVDGVITATEFDQSGPGWMYGHVDADTYRFSGGHDDNSQRATLFGSVSAAKVYISDDGVTTDTEITSDAEIDFTDELHIDGGDIWDAQFVGATDPDTGKAGGTVYQTAGDSSASVTARDYVQSGGTMGGVVNVDTYTQSGGSVINWVQDPSVIADTYLQSGGDMSADAVVGTYTQTGGDMNGTVTATSYTQSGGNMNGTVTADDYVQSGGDNWYGVVHAGTYEQSGGTVWWDVEAGTYKLTGSGGAQIDAGGMVHATDLFDLDPDSDVTLSGGLQGSGKLVKSGNATVTVGADAEGNDVQGDIEVKGGTLVYAEGWAARTGDLTVDAGATFRSIGSDDTRISGSMTGEGTFEYSGNAQFGIGARDPDELIDPDDTGLGTKGPTIVDMGGLKVTSGGVRIGTSYFDIYGDGTTGNSIDATFGQVNVGGTVTDPSNDVSGLGVLEIERGSSLTTDRLVVTAGTVNASPVPDWYGTQDDPDTEEDEGAAYRDALPPSLLHAGTVDQSGGLISGNGGSQLYIDTTTFTQTGGYMGAAVTATDYDLSGGTIGSESTIDVSHALTITGDGQVEWNAHIVGGDPDGKVVVTQDGAGTVMDGVITSADDEDPTISAYNLKAGTVDSDAIIKTGDAIVQSGGDMRADYLDTWSYWMSGGTLEAANNSGDPDELDGWVVDFHMGADDGDPATDDTPLAGDGVIKSGNYKFIHGLYVDSGTIGADARFFYDPDWGDPEDNGFVVQSGGLVDGTVVATNYSQSGGTIGADANIRTQSYSLSSASSIGGTIDASTAFDLDVGDGSANVSAQLTGTGKLTKSGAGTVVLRNGANDFSGGVAIDGGTLNAINDALPDHASVSIAQDATLEMTIGQGISTNLTGSIAAGQGTLVKDGAGTLALTGAVSIGTVDVNAGTLHVTDDGLDDFASIDVAAAGALQLTTSANKSIVLDRSIGVGGSLIKDGAGTLTLDGSYFLGDLTVGGGQLNIGTGDESSPDDASFESAVIASGATVYVAKNATFTIRVPNNIVNNGFLINDGTVYDDLANTSIFNNNNAYVADVTSNTGTINNNTPGVWTGNIDSNRGVISNNDGATWNGDVLDNGNHAAPSLNYQIWNQAGGVWNGEVADNYGTIRNIGTWNGDLVDNHYDVMSDNQADEVGVAYWNGNVIANEASIFNAGGSIWTGDVVSNAGTIKSDRTTQFAFDDPSHTGIAEWHGNVDANTGSIENRGYWYGDIKGNSSWIFNTGAWAGDVYAGNVANIFNVEDDYNVAPSDRVRASFTGTVKGNAGSIVNMGADWTGAVEANTGSIANTSGIYNQVQTGDSTWTGNVVTNAGTITNRLGSTWTGNVLANTGTITNTGVWNGGFTNSAGGEVYAQNQINGSFSNAGTLYMTGPLTGITALTNSGTLDLRDGTAAGQTLTVTTADLKAGSTLDVSIDAAGNTDKLVAGTATLGGALNVTLNPIVGNSDYSKTYTFLTADDRSGAFSDVTTDLAFLDPQLDYFTPGEVKLALTENHHSFEGVATTPNQKAAAAAIQAMGSDDPVYKAILGLTAEQADEAFQQLSGSSQSATQSADVQAATLVSDILSGRIDQAFDAVGGGDDSPSNYAEGPAIVANPTPTTGMWGQFYGAYGSVASTATIAGVNSTAGGFAAGLDGELGNWRLGAMVQAGATGTAIPDANAASNSIDYGGGVYGGGEFGNTRLSFGADYTRHNIDATRQVAFPGFDETLSASYAANTAQGFAQISQLFDLYATSLTPYASVDYVANGTDAYTETGGVAAVSTASNVIDATFTTLGVNASQDFVVGDSMLLTADGGLGWRHAFADTASATNSLAGGTSFTVLGAPMASDMVVVDAGLNLDVSAATTLNLNYAGQFGVGTQTHGLKATWNGKF